MGNILEWLGLMCSMCLPCYNFSPAKGIGKFIALDFARRGARVILACRNQQAGAAAVQEIRDLTNNQDVHLRPLDTSSLISVREFASMINKDEKALHILVNNAGASGQS